MIDFYVLLTMGELKLLVLQQDIRAVEVVEDIQTKLEEEEAAAGIMGWIAFSDQQYPVFSLDEHLNVHSHLPENHHLCVLLHAGEEAVVGLTCTTVQSLNVSYRPHIVPLPACMRIPGTPISGLAVHNKQLLCISNAAALMNYLTAWTERRLAELEMEED